MRHGLIDGSATRRRIGAALATAALALSGSALANTSSHTDPRKDVLGDYERSYDITRATAGHQNRKLRHRIIVRARPSRGKALMAINTKGGRRSDAEFFITSKGVFKAADGTFDPSDDPVAPARVSRPSNRSLEFTFSQASIRRPGSYGWRVALFGRNSFDSVPDPGDRYEVHDLSLD